MSLELRLPAVFCLWLHVVCVACRTDVRHYAYVVVAALHATRTIIRKILHRTQNCRIWLRLIRGNFYLFLHFI